MPASIWLRPTIQKAAELQRIIDRLSEAHGTVTFRPHLTVCGIPGDLGVLDAASAYVKECGLLPLKVAKVAVTGAVITPFRAVFIEVENTPQLQEFRERLRQICGAPPLIPPHIWRSRSRNSCNCGVFSTSIKTARNGVITAPVTAIFATFSGNSRQSLT